MFLDFKIRYISLHSAIKILQKSGDPNSKTPWGWLDFFIEGKPTNSSLVFNLCFKGDQLKVKLANHKFSKIGDGP